MNKSEIAERASRTLAAMNTAFLALYLEVDGSIVEDLRRRFNEHLAAQLELQVERAIAESRGQPCPHLNRVKSTEPDSATLCTDCDTYLPKSELGDGEPSSAPPDCYSKIGLAYENAAEHARNRPHETTPILVWADIDKGIAGLVGYLNTIPGVRTDASCQGTIGEGGPHPYEAYVMATWNKEADARLNAEFEIEYLGEFWGYVRQKSASGAAQEVSPPSPVKVIESVRNALSKLESQISRRSSELPAGYGKICNDAFDAIQQLEFVTNNFCPQHLKIALCSTGPCMACARPRGDTRELKAALTMHIEHLKAWHPEMVKAENGVGGCAANWIGLVERLLGEPTKE